MIHARIIFLDVLLLAIACSPREPTKCQSGDQCPAGSRCLAGVCAAAPRPIAALSPVGKTEIYDLVTLDGSASLDPSGAATGASGIKEHRWTVTSSGAPCAPPVVASHDPRAKVRFGCAGDYTLSLVVVNDLSVESEPLTTTISAVPSTRPAVITSGSDVVLGHQCSGTPLFCTVDSELVLTAHSTAPSVAYRWTVEPPEGRALAGVQFAPNATSASPHVTITSDGAGMSGDWVFRVEGRDDFGVVGAAVTRVSVLNSWPTLTRVPSAVSVDHHFDAGRSRFVASGQIGYERYDGDGDANEVSATFRHTGDGAATFTGRVRESPPADPQSGGGYVEFSVEIPYEAKRLPDGVYRAVDVVLRDANGWEVRAVVPVTVANHAPVQVASPNTVTVPHRFDPATSRYLATANLGTWSDPDGDPLVVSGGADPCNDVSIVNGAVTVTCSVPYNGVPAVNKLAGSRTVSIGVTDPWGAESGATYVLDILNSPPSLEVVDDPATFRGTYACNSDGTHPATIYAGDFTATPAVWDPDGDPVTLRLSRRNGGTSNPAVQTCLAAACLPIQVHEPAQTFATWPTNYQSPSSLSASDGAASVSVDATPPPDMTSACPP
jgi:hypothetical protein